MHTSKEYIFKQHVNATWSNWKQSIREVYFSALGKFAVGSIAVGNFAMGYFAVGKFAVKKFRLKEILPQGNIAVGR